MIKYVFEIAPAAEQDIAHAYRWYLERNATAAAGFRSEAFDAVDYVFNNPLSRPEDADGNRKWVLKHFPYSVVYEVVAHKITVLAVAHHRRRPDYWR